MGTNSCNSIPILYYHSVANHNRNRPWSFLSCEIDVFEKQMEYLYDNNYLTCSWDELYDHIQGRRQLPEKTVMIHFDDGFLDNWSVVFPIMKKYGLKFSIVVSPDFIERRDIKRPFVKCTYESNIDEWWGYLSLGELKEMEASGLVDIQAHGYSHTWYPISDEIIDIYDGTQIEPWLYWNRNIKDKPYWLTKELSEVIPIGTPIFKNEKSLANLKAFIPDEEFIRGSIEIYDPELSKEENIKNMELLKREYEGAGRYESEEESYERLVKELKGTREFLKTHLNKRVEYLVWPGGGNNRYVQKLAMKLGYKLISKGVKPNRFNSKIDKVMRVAGYYRFNSELLNPYLNKLFFMLQIERGSGNETISKGVDLIKQIKKRVENERTI